MLAQLQHQVHLADEEDEQSQLGHWRESITGISSIRWQARSYTVARK